DPHAVGFDVYRVVDVQQDRAIQTAAGVPTRILPRPHLHPDLVRFAEPEEGLDVDEEPGVAVGAVAGELVVDEDHRMPEGALELEPDDLVRPLDGDVEGLQVRIGAGWMVGARPASGGVRG